MGCDQGRRRRNFGFGMRSLDGGQIGGKLFGSCLKSVAHQWRTGGMKRAGEFGSNQDHSGENDLFR